jgi:hypothetical protein
MRKDPNFCADFRAVVGTLLVVRNPLSATVLTKFLTLDSRRPPLHAISRLGRVLYTNDVIRILHSSFADFLSNGVRRKSDEWFIDLTSRNLCVSVNCLDRLEGFFRHNVGVLKLSLTPVDVSLPENISYPSAFWIEHVCITKDALAIAERLETFLFKYLLHWFEVMSILKRSRDTIELLSRLREWYRVRRA